jgi:hypothetical protein
LVSGWYWLFEFGSTPFLSILWNSLGSIL